MLGSVQRCYSCSMGYLSNNYSTLSKLNYFNIPEVRLKENGSESFEVTDNGSGVEEKNFEALSKLTLFSDKYLLLQAWCASDGKVMNS